MKKRFLSLLLCVCMVITMLSALPVPVAAAEESFDVFVANMQTMYNVDVICERDTPMTKEEQIQLNIGLGAFGADFVRTVSATLGQLSSNYSRLQIHIANPDGKNVGVAKGIKLYLNGTDWDAVTIMHEFTHTIHQAANTIKSGAENEMMSALSSVNPQPYGTAWQPGDEAYYAWNYGKTNAKEDIATIMSRFDDMNDPWATKVKEGKLPVIKEKIGVFRSFVADYIGTSPLLEEILGAPIKNPPTELVYALMNERKIELEKGKTFQFKVASSLPTTAPLPTFDTYTSDNPGIASIDQQGIITARQPGKTRLYARMVENKKHVYIYVTVTGEQTATSLSFTSKPKSVMKVGETLQMAYEFLPKGTTNTVNIFSTDPNVVSVDQSGMVSAIAPGKATVKVALNDGPTYLFAITVSALQVTSINIPEKLSLKIGESSSLKPTLEPAGSAGTMKYTSSSPNVASVDSNGVITAKAVGRTNITASVNTIKAVCEVTVQPSQLTSISITPAESVLKIGQTVQLSTILQPNSASTSITYTSSNSSVVEVGETGLVTAKKLGTAFIVAKSDGLTATSKITVSTLEPTGIALDKTSAQVSVDETLSLTATLKPADAVGTVTYKSSNSTVAAVDKDGVVTGKKVGTAVITATTGKLSATCNVTVTNIAPTGLALDQTTVTLDASKTTQLKATITPSGAASKITYSSSDTKIAAVSTSGLITAKAAGTAVITAKAGNLSATCTVTVNTSPTKQAVITDGWYQLSCMDNFLNIANGGAELRSTGAQKPYLVTHQGDGKYTLQTVDGKYLGISDTIKNGVQAKALTNKYLWTIYAENGKDTFSLRPVGNSKMVLNASGQKNTDGTRVTLWTYENIDAPKNGEFHFSAAKASAEPKPDDSKPNDSKPNDTKSTAPVTASPSSTKLMVNGESVGIDAYLINQNNYIKLRDLATLLNRTEKNFEVTWDGTKNAINLKSKNPYTTVGGELAKGDGKGKTAALSTSAIYVDGIQVTMTAYNIGGNNYFKLRDVMQVFDVYVGWDQATSTASLDTSRSYQK